MPRSKNKLDSSPHLQALNGGWSLISGNEFTKTFSNELLCVQTVVGVTTPALIPPTCGILGQHHCWASSSVVIVVGVAAL
jgi:hypothetical protein